MPPSPGEPSWWGRSSTAIRVLVCALVAIGGLMLVGIAAAAVSGSDDSSAAPPQAADTADPGSTSEPPATTADATPANAVANIPDSVTVVLADGRKIHIAQVDGPHDSTDCYGAASRAALAELLPTGAVITTTPEPKLKPVDRNGRRVALRIQGIDECRACDGQAGRCGAVLPRRAPRPLCDPADGCGPPGSGRPSRDVGSLRSHPPLPIRPSANQARTARDDGDGGDRRGHDHRRHRSPRPARPNRHPRSDQRRMLCIAGTSSSGKPDPAGHPGHSQSGSQPRPDGSLRAPAPLRLQERREPQPDARSTGRRSAVLLRTATTVNTQGSSTQQRLPPNGRTAASGTRPRHPAPTDRGPGHNRCPPLRRPVVAVDPEGDQAAADGAVLGLVAPPDTRPASLTMAVRTMTAAAAAAMARTTPLSGPHTPSPVRTRTVSTPMATVTAANSFVTGRPIRPSPDARVAPEPRRSPSPPRGSVRDPCGP